MSISVIEVAKRYNDLIAIAKKMGFSVIEKDSRMEWKANNGKIYKVYPIVKSTEINKIIFEPNTTVFVLLDGCGDFHNNQVIDWDEIKKISDLLDEKKTSSETVQLAFELKFSVASLYRMTMILNGHNNECKSKENEHTEKKAIEKKINKMEYIELLAQYTGKEFLLVQKNKYVSSDDTFVIQAFSKKYDDNARYDEYWYSIHRNQLEEMEKHRQGYYSFGFFDRVTTVLIEKNKFEELLPILTISPNAGDPYWHIKVHVYRKDKSCILKTKKEFEDIDIKKTKGIQLLDGVKEEKKPGDGKKVITLGSNGLKAIPCKKR